MWDMTKTDFMSELWREGFCKGGGFVPVSKREGDTDSCSLFFSVDWRRAAPENLSSVLIRIPTPLGAAITLVILLQAQTTSINYSTASSVRTKAEKYR